MDRIPSHGFLRLCHILGSPKKNLRPIIPVSPSTWWAGIHSGRYPEGIKHGGATFWKAQDIEDLVRRIEDGEAGEDDA